MKTLLGLCPPPIYILRPFITALLSKHRQCRRGVLCRPERVQRLVAWRWFKVVRPGQPVGRSCLRTSKKPLSMSQRVAIEPEFRIRRRRCPCLC